MAEDWSGDEEEILFFVDFDSKIGDAETLIEKEFKLLGLESDEPILQTGGSVFKGEWKEAMGTYLFFEEDPESSDKTGDSNKEQTFSGDLPSEGMLKYICKTGKLLQMSRIFVNPKTAVTPQQSDEKQEEAKMLIEDQLDHLAVDETQTPTSTDDNR